MAQAQYAGTGRRKNAVARVRLVPGTGKITVNKKDVEEYIPHADLRLVINQPFAVTSTEGSYDVHVNVVGGGYAGQSGAIRHGIARALLQVDPDFRDSLKRAGKHNTNENTLQLARCFLYENWRCAIRIALATLVA